MLVYNETNDCPSSLDGNNDFINQALAEGKKHIPKMFEVQLAVPWDQDTERDQLYHERVIIQKQNNRLTEIKNNLKEVTKKIKDRVKHSKWYTEKHRENINHTK